MNNHPKLLLFIVVFTIVLGVVIAIAEPNDAQQQQQNCLTGRYRVCHIVQDLYDMKYKRVKVIIDQTLPTFTSHYRPDTGQFAILVPIEEAQNYYFGQTFTLTLTPDAEPQPKRDRP